MDYCRIVGHIPDDVFIRSHFRKDLNYFATKCDPVNRGIMLLFKESVAGMLSYDAQVSCAIRLMISVSMNRSVSYSKTVTV